MPYTTTDRMDFAEFGLVTDIPSDSLPLAVWSDALNVRARDGSVQGVNDFVDAFALTSGLKPVAVTQWTPAGTNHLNIAIITGDSNNDGQVFVHNTNTSTTEEITNSTVGAQFTINDTYRPQIFVFNELLIVNPATGNPQYITADATTAGSLQDLPGWAAFAVTQYARILRPFGNRLMAMNFFDDKDTALATDDVSHPIDLAWSSTITDIGSLTGAKWQVASDNTAGNAFVTATPGPILDGLQLGEYFIVYKSDAVIRVSELGDADFILRIESIFEDDGIYSNGCVANIGNSQHLVIGNYGVFIHDGQSEKTDIAKGKFQEALFALVNPSHRDRSFCFQQTRDKEVWFCASSSSNSGAGCDIAFVYDYESKKLHKRTLPNVLDIYETEINGSLRIFAASPDDNTIQELSNTLLVADGWFEVENKLLGPLMVSNDVISMYINAGDEVNLALTGTYNIKDTKTYTDVLFNPAETYKVDVRVNGRYMNLRMTMAGTKNPDLTTISFKVKEAARR